MGMAEVFNKAVAEKPGKGNNWLSEFSRNVTSQFGEDGIIEKILEVIGETDKWCVEFGSWDGVKTSNTYELVSKKDYHAVLIECDQKRFKDLLNTYQGNDRVVPVNTLVGFEGHDSLEVILSDTKIPMNFDLLSIDVDGNDYHIWSAVKKYKPKVVVVEFNPTIPPEVEFVQPADVSVTQGSSLLAMNKLAESKGYRLVAATLANAFFVDSKYYDKFEIADNSIDEIWKDRSQITHLFCGFDGTIFLRGNMMLPWQLIPYKESKVQHVPRWARKRFGDTNFIRRNLGKFYRRWLKKKK